MHQAGDEHGRVAQRRRTRKAIIQAAIELLAEGETPSIADVAARAEVSKRTIYMYFRSLDHLLTDATVGALTQATIGSLFEADEGGDDVVARVDALARAVVRQQDEESERLGRTLIRLTVESPADDQGTTSPRRGYRRVEWIEQALAPLRARVDEERFERLVSALAMVIGWEAMLVLRDIRGLDRVEEEAVSSWAARVLVKATLDELEEEAPPS
jgi:AcrR family transcriptional regulator